MIAKLRTAAALAIAVVSFTPAFADEFKPAYLALKQTDAESFRVVWRVPALNETTALALMPRFPTGTEDTSPHRVTFAAGARVERWSIRVPGGVAGKVIEFSDHSAVRTDVLVRIEHNDGTATQLGRVTPLESRFVAAARPAAFEVVRAYTVLGIEHILTGIDHLLFVLALLMIVPGRRMLFATITAFTLAHSITLALATLGIVSVPGPPVEAVIALSIAFVAAGVVAHERGREQLATRRPWAVAFGFGLLHGLGFAGALTEVGLPEHSIPLALLFFNVGVEIGQLIFVGAVLLVAHVARRLTIDPELRRRGVILPAYAIGGVASYWVFERVTGF